jgi:LytS/YehU family sensor histidine kinase
MLKLSALLRYSLYDTNQHYVPLQKELNYITNYVALERIRLNDRADIVLDMPGDFSDRYIAPLLLIIFIENSFKHFSAPRKQQGFVHISLTLQDHLLQMKTRNSIDPDYPLPVKNKEKGGLGLNNVRQRLTLIYPQKHTLVIKREPEYFEVDLQIDLS